VSLYGFATSGYTKNYSCTEYSQEINIISIALPRHQLLVRRSYHFIKGEGLGFAKNFTNQKNHCPKVITCRNIDKAYFVQKSRS